MAYTITNRHANAKKRVIDLVFDGRVDFLSQIITGTGTPTFNANFVGQLFLDETASKVYKASDEAGTWVDITP